MMIINTGGRLVSKESAVSSGKILPIADQSTVETGKTDKSEFLDLLNYLGFPSYLNIEVELDLDESVEMDPELHTELHSILPSSIFGLDQYEGLSESTSKIGGADYRKDKQETMWDVLSSLNPAAILSREYRSIEYDQAQSGEMQPNPIMISTGEKTSEMSGILLEHQTQLQETTKSGFTVEIDLNEETNLNVEAGADKGRSIFTELVTEVIETETQVDAEALFRVENLRLGSLREQPDAKDRTSGPVSSELEARNPVRVPEEEQFTISSTTSTSATVPQPIGLEGQTKSEFLTEDGADYSTADVISQVEQKFISGINDKGINEFSFSLKPDGLGSIKVKLREKEGLIQLELVAERNETERILSSEIEQLRQTLKNHNVDLIKVTTLDNLQEPQHHDDGFGESAGFASQEQMQWNSRDRRNSMAYRTDILDGSEERVNKLGPDYRTNRIYSSGHLEIII